MNHVAGPSTAIKVALLAAALCGTPLVAELALRLATGDRLLTVQPVLEPDGVAYRPGQHARFKAPEWDIAIDVNAQGFRDLDRPAAPAPDGSVVVLGSSFVEGYGVAVEETFPRQLQRELEARGRHAWVYNAGHHATFVARQQRTYMTRFRQVPDLKTVVLALCVNQDLGLAGQSDGAPAMVLTSPWKAWLGAHSALYNVAGRGVKSAPALRALARRAGLLADDDILLAPPYDVPATRPLLEASLPLVRALAGQVRADGRRFVVALLPMKEQVDGAFFAQLVREFGTDPSRVARMAVYDEVRRALKDEGLEVVDPYPALCAAHGPRLFFESDRHYAPPGHAIVARALADALTAAPRAP